MKISETHANFFVNEDEAKKSDFIDFVNRVQCYLRRNYGIEFKIEVKVE